MKINQLQLNQTVLNDIFQMLRQVHDSHWKAPLIHDVHSLLESDKVYAFKAGPERLWTCRLLLRQEDQEIHIEYCINQDLPKEMRKKQELMKLAFDERLKVLEKRIS